MIHYALFSMGVFSRDDAVEAYCTVFLSFHQAEFLKNITKKNVSAIISFRFRHKNAVLVLLLNILFGFELEL